MERARLAALNGDKMLSMPFICLIAQEAWRAKEAKTPQAECREWGPESQRGPMWEYLTAVCMIQAGGDILVMRHPKAVEETRKYIERMISG
jgi:acetyl-CoA decarbonylase/synthase complex subunit delta